MSSLKGRKVGKVGIKICYTSNLRTMSAYTYALIYTANN